MKSILAALVVVLAVCVSPAEAAKCSVASTSVIFGPYNVFSSAPVDSIGTIVYNCSGGARNLQIAISRGQSDTFNARTLKKGLEALEYNLFLDASRTIIWGDGNGASEVYLEPSPPNRADVSVPVYGRIPQFQDISVGSYADNVTVTINF